MTWKDLILLLLLFPLGMYLRDATYKMVHGRNIIKEDLLRLLHLLRQWKQHIKQIKKKQSRKK